jgi:galactokinase
VPAEHESGARPRRTSAFAPGRVNLIGEHTDYNQGLALPFAIREGVSVDAEAIGGSPARIVAHARDLDAGDEFPVADPPPSTGWRAFVRGVVAEIARAGSRIPGARLEIAGEVPRGAGLSSSAAMEVALCLALLGLCGRHGEEDLDRIEIARLCARVENEWVGAQTGLLDQLACLYGRPDAALLIDFRSLAIEPVPCVLGDWRLFVLDSGQRHSHASSGYNERRRECERACELLGVRSLRETSLDAVAALPQPLRDRATHVLGENERVREAVAALAAGDLPALGALLDAAHASLRDRYEVSTPALEAAVGRMRAAGAAGARLIGGGFGGSVLGLFAPAAQPPPGAREVRPGPGAHLIASGA